MTFRKLEDILHRRKEILNEQFLRRSVAKARRGKFYMFNRFPREYKPLLKQSYGRVMANHVSNVLMVLASHSDKDGLSYPNYETIMYESLISNRNTLRTVLKLMADELDMLGYYPGKGKVPNVYKLLDEKFWKPLSIKNNSLVSKKPDLRYQINDTQRSSQ